MVSGPYIESCSGICAVRVLWCRKVETAVLSLFWAIYDLFPSEARMVPLFDVRVGATPYRSSAEDTPSNRDGITRQREILLEHFSERNLADSSSLVNDDVRMSGTPIGLVIDGGMGGIE